MHSHTTIDAAHLWLPSENPGRCRRSPGARHPAQTPCSSSSGGGAVTQRGQQRGETQGPHQTAAIRGILTAPPVALGLSRQAGRQACRCVGVQMSSEQPPVNPPVGPPICSPTPPAHPPVCIPQWRPRLLHCKLVLEAAAAAPLHCDPERDGARALRAWRATAERQQGAASACGCAEGRGSLFAAQCEGCRQRQEMGPQQDTSRQRTPPTCACSSLSRSTAASDSVSPSVLKLLLLLLGAGSACALKLRCCWQCQGAAAAALLCEAADAAAATRCWLVPCCTAQARRPRCCACCHTGCCCQGPLQPLLQGWPPAWPERPPAARPAESCAFCRWSCAVKPGTREAE